MAERILTPIILLIFFATSLYATVGVSVFNSPDENANAVFAQTFAQTGGLLYREPLNTEVDGILHPRSMFALGENIVPRSFAGLPVLAGIVARAFGDFGMVLVTPIATVFAALAWRSVVRKLFDDKRLANLAALFLLFHPAFWYYSARPMMHNVLFAALLIFAAWFLICRPLKKRVPFLNELLGGVMLGLAIATRTSEIIWVTVLVAGLLGFALLKKKMTWQSILLIAAGALIALAPFAYLNHQTYGAPWITGYTMQVPMEVAPEVAPNPWAPRQDDYGGILGILFPFGFHERATLFNVWHYGFLLYPISGVFAVIGAIAVWRKKDSKWHAFLMATLALAAWLGVVYGSWMIFDHPDTAAVTIGNSHVRYWIPVFVLASVLSAQGILCLKKKSWMALAVIAFIAASGHIVFRGDDGLFKMRENLKRFEEEKAFVLQYTPNDAVIVVNSEDKFLFPERRVITPMNSVRTYLLIDDIAAHMPVYYFGDAFIGEQQDSLNVYLCEEYDISLRSVTGQNDRALYRFEVPCDAYLPF